MLTNNHLNSIYNLSIQATAKDHGVDVSLIPRSSKGNCAEDKIYRTRFGACSCDTHCSWDQCRLFIPPNDCLLDTNSIWKWDNIKNAWVAQLLRGNCMHRYWLDNIRIIRINVVTLIHHNMI